VVPQRQLLWDDDPEPDSPRSYRGQFVFDFALEPRLAAAGFHALNAECRSRTPRPPRGPADKSLSLDWESGTDE